MDKRILKSEHAIKTAFLRLCRNKDPHRISVVDLCKEAKINRSTFYERYGYIDNLIYDILLNEVKKICEINPEISTGNLQVLNKDVIRHYLNNFIKNEIIKLFCNCERSERYCQQIIELHVQITLNQESDPHLFYPAYFQNTGVVSMVLKWMKDQMPVSINEMTEIIYQFSKAMFLDYKKGRFYN